MGKEGTIDIEKRFKIRERERARKGGEEGGGK